ncbi:MAG: 50S ribosomal protein L9 [Thiohalomonadaceae bacterium]
MEVILLEKVRNLGTLGEKVRVRSGYGRNYLMPRGMAVMATKANIEKFEARRAELEQVAAEILAAAEAKAVKIAELGSVTIAHNAGDGGRLFGSIGTADIATALADAGIEIKRQDIAMPDGSIRQIGEFEIDLNLHTDVTQVIKVIVVAA